MTSILIVDDDKEVGMIFKVALRKVAHQVHYVNNSADALDLAQQIQPQIIFVDLHLAHSDINGWELIVQLRACEACQTNIIIGITAGSEQDVEKAYQAGCTDVLRKPFLPQAILDTIAKYAVD